MTLSRYQVGEDERAGHERLRSRRGNMAIGEFGERVMHKDMHAAEN